MSKRRRDIGETLFDVLNEDEELTTFHKLLLNKFDSIISFLQRIDEKVYSIDHRLSILEHKNNKQEDPLASTKEEEEITPLPEKEISEIAAVAPIAELQPTNTSTITTIPTTEQPQIPTTSNPILIKEEIEDDESSQSILEIEDLQNLAAKSEAVEIEDVSFILPNEVGLNETSCASFSQHLDTLDSSCSTAPPVYTQGNFNCMEDEEHTFRSFDHDAPFGFCRFDRNIKIIDILKNSIKGKVAIEEFKTTGTLNKLSRKVIIHEIINYVCLRKMWLRRNDLAFICHQIKTIFPGEKPEYYVRFPPKGKNISPLGALWNNWKYRSSQIKKDIRALHESSVRPTSLIKPNKESPHTTKSQAIITNKEWLRLNTEPWSEVTEKWTDTIQQRKQDISNLRKNDLLDAWPLLKHPFAYTLIGIDFNHYFPEKSSKLLDDWETYSTKIIVMAITKARKSNNIELSSEFTAKSKYAVQSDDIRNTENVKAFKALNYILPGSFERQEGLDVILGSLEVGESIYTKNNMENPCPKIYVAKDIRDIPIKFHVAFRSMIFSFDNFLTALDMLMKVILTLDISYPSESETLLTFLQLFFYEIICENRKNNNSSIYTVVYDLNADKMKYF